MLLATDDADTTDASSSSAIRRGYVVNDMRIPTTQNESRDFALDLGGRSSAFPDGILDNALGNMFATLASIELDVQGTTSTAIDRGAILTLLDFQSTDFINATDAKLEVKVGTDPIPQPCSSPDDTICRRHLTGTGSFAVAAGSTPEQPIAGAIVNGTFRGGPGTVVAQLAMNSISSVTLTLLHARIRATDISDAGITAILGGVVTIDDAHNTIGLVLRTQVFAFINRDCTDTSTPPSCGCSQTSTGATMIGIFDSNRDCQVSVDEVLASPMIKSSCLPIPVARVRAALPMRYRWASRSLPSRPASRCSRRSAMSPGDAGDQRRSRGARNDRSRHPH